MPADDDVGDDDDRGTAGVRLQASFGSRSGLLTAQSGRS
jgi:hypothetical protein